MPNNILITDKVHPFLIEELEKDGHEIAYHPKMPLSETLEVVQNYEGLIVNSKTICDKKLFDKAKKLKYIGRLGSGLEIIDLTYAAEKGVKVIRTPDGNCDAVAEHALGMLLSLFNQFKRAERQLKILNWQREANRGTEIRGKTIGIIGYGHTGPALHELLKSFGAQIIIYDKYRTPYDDELFLTEMMEQADVISIHLPLTDETIGYADKAFFDSVSKPFYLINTARGKNVVLPDLVEALDSGKVLGACLDVFENEKPDTYNFEEDAMYIDLHNRENVICTPHVAGWTHESLLRIAESMLRQIREI